MTLRGKIFWAMVPLVAAQLVVSVAGGYLLTALGRSSRRILADNYRSVLAMERIKDAVEALDETAVQAVAGRRDRAQTTGAEARRRCEAELRVQESNITEPGERALTERVRAAWTDYQERYDRFLARPDSNLDAYLDGLHPAVAEVKAAADAVLAMNQDAIVRKSEVAQRAANRYVTFLAIAAILGLLIAIVGTATLTSRVVRPLSVLGQATRRLGEGDLAARAHVAGTDEIAQVAGDFNRMAESLAKYRQSSLGELLEAQRASQATIDSLPDPVVVVTVQDELLQANRAADTVLHISVEGGLSGLDPPVRAVVERLHQHVTSGKGAYTPRGLDEAIRIAAPEGDRWFLPRGAPVYSDEGAVVGTTLVFQDVTRLLRFEELRNNLVATVAHEFRTPLTSLRMAIHVLTGQRVGPLTEKQADLVFAAREDCERLQSTVDELLDLSRIQAGRIELRPRPVEVEALVDTAVEAQRAVAAERKVALRSEVLPGVGSVLADPERIQLVFANLILNAIRHSPEGGEVTIRANDVERVVRIEVVDRGPGIPREFQQAIFEKYFQMPGSPPGGAGLGLFITKEIMDAHGGRIGVTSEPGQGSTFWFELAKEATSPSDRAGDSRRPAP